MASRLAHHSRSVRHRQCMHDVGGFLFLRPLASCAKWRRGAELFDHGATRLSVWTGERRRRVQ